MAPPFATPTTSWFYYCLVHRNVYHHSIHPTYVTCQLKYLIGLRRSLTRGANELSWAQVLANSNSAHQLEDWFELELKLKLSKEMNLSLACPRIESSTRTRWQLFDEVATNTAGAYTKSQRSAGALQEEQWANWQSHCESPDEVTTISRCSTRRMTGKLEKSMQELHYLGEITMSSWRRCFVEEETTFFFWRRNNRLQAALIEIQ